MNRVTLNNYTIIMKKWILFFGFYILLVACSSTRFIDSWKNNEVSEFKPNKLLVIGITDNLTARKTFEETLSNAFIKKGINAHQSINYFNSTFTSLKKSESEIDAMILNLSKEGFDAVIITAVKGEENKKAYSNRYYVIDYRWTKFGRYYYNFQDIYYTPNYYDTYKVYHVETSIYNINAAENKSLIWVGSLDIVNPHKITAIVNSYAKKIIWQLENERLIPFN
jgi:hypothetical protein